VHLAARVGVVERPWCDAVRCLLFQDTDERKYAVDDEDPRRRQAQG
jgi:hypothetical protein